MSDIYFEFLVFEGDTGVTVAIIVVLGIWILWKKIKESVA